MAVHTPQVGCSTLHFDVLQFGCQAATGAAGAGADKVTGAVSGAVTDKVGEWLVGGVTGAGEKMIEGLDWSLKAATTPNLGAAWFLGNYGMVLGIALVMAAVTFIIQIVSSLIKREPGMLTRAVTGSAVGVVGGFVVLSVCQVLLIATDELCSGLLRTSGQGSLTTSLSDGWTLSMGALGPGAWLLAFLLGILFVVGLIMLWIVMFLREIGIYVLAVFAPIAFAGYGWDATRSWLRRWAQVVAAMIFSKLVIYIVFLLAAAMMAEVAQADNVLAAITQLIGGVVMLWMAAFSPWAVYRFISFAGNATADLHEHEGPRSPVGASAMMAVSTGMVVGRKVGNIVGGGMTGGAGGAAAGAAAPAGGGQLPGQAADAGTPTGGAGGGAGGDGGAGGGNAGGGNAGGGNAGGAPAPPPPNPAPGGGGSPRPPVSPPPSPAGGSGGSSGAGSGGGGAAAPGGAGSAGAGAGAAAV